ncbi:MAG: hypothetical protein HC904_04420 [Blastochloris sp.]|nr:hypothetical protein [Blastochloris sp.]
MRNKTFLGLGLALGLGALALGSLWLFSGFDPAPSSRREVSQAGLKIKPVAAAPVLPILVQGEAGPRALAPAPSARQALFPSNLSYDARLRAIHALGTQISPAERTLLLDYLRESFPQDGLNPEQRNGLKNDILNVLRAQEPAVQELTRTLVDLYQDSNQTLIMRDYALQHLSEYRDKAATLNQAAEIDRALWRASRETTQTYAGTALLALARQAEQSEIRNQSALGGSEISQVGRAALELASDESAPLASRITALSVAGRMGEKDVLPLALTYARDSQQMALQRSALATLALLEGQGNKISPADKETLRLALRGSELLQQPNIRNLLLN